MIISSQDYICDKIVAEKMATKDFTVFVSPEMTMEGVAFQVLIDGHHSYAAAIKAGVSPVIVELTSSDHDAIGLPVEDFLQVLHMGSDYKDVATGRDVW